MDDLEDLARRQARAQNGLDPSRAGPEPWFVGSGKGLMLLIVSLVVVLIAVRGVTTMWMAQDAWAWWTHRSRAAASRPTPVHVLQPARVRAAPAAMTLPPRAAAATVNPGAWFDANSYPPASIRSEEEGRTVARVLIGTDGGVRSCGIVTSSGHQRLDAATCDTLIRRALFSPARDGSGAAIVSTKNIPVRWVLPRD